MQPDLSARHSIMPYIPLRPQSWKRAAAADARTGVLQVHIAANALLLFHDPGSLRTWLGLAACVLHYLRYSSFTRLRPQVGSSAVPLSDLQRCSCMLTDPLLRDKCACDQLHVHPRHSQSTLVTSLEHDILCLCCIERPATEWQMLWPARLGQVADCAAESRKGLPVLVGRRQQTLLMLCMHRACCARRRPLYIAMAPKVLPRCCRPPDQYPSMRDRSLLRRLQWTWILRLGGSMRAGSSWQSVALCWGQTCMPEAQPTGPGCEGPMRSCTCSSAAASGGPGQQHSWFTIRSSTQPQSLHC